MPKRLLDWNQDSGVASWWHQDGEGNWAQEAVQFAAPILDLNKEAANHCNPYNAERDVRMVARIPLIIIEKWRNEFGVDYWLTPSWVFKVAYAIDNRKVMPSENMFFVQLGWGM